MSLDLIDFRGKITAETDAVLEAMHRTTGRDRSEIARQVLSDWAELKIHEASLLDKLLAREGLRGIQRGVSGSARESQGVSGSLRESEGLPGSARGGAIGKGRRAA